ncbi:hypothetical protein JG688_00011617 [Phytophthora aleatoria]|uniref:Glycosyltransferase 61 catalytic domain-containing protein n=1 Tax=Phytophthora aleatoria TaxID=2496075 RepID=A0A8J5ICR7_9STRA|nr:hypothetical protein JG688_00011617 [Phytophthora aleatoria]
MVFANAVYRGDPPPDIWSEKGCMGHYVSHTSFEHDLSTNASELALERGQAQLVIPTVKKTETVIVSGRKPRDAIVNNIYKVMVGQHLHKPGSVFAKRLVFSCRAPLIHPFTTQRITENIFQSLPPSATASESDRNIILFLSRSSGGKAFNGGRRILNEPKLFDAISSMLKATGRPEKLQYFRHDKFNGLDDVATFMRDRVKMMIGPHGAAFYNARFAQPHTALIEIIPDPNKFFVPCFWEQARLLGQDYSAHVGETQNAQNDMMVDDIQNVVQLVQDRLAYLDKSYRMQDALDHKYAWDVGLELDVSDDYVRKALKLRGLDDAALKAHANYRYHEFFSRKAVENRLYKQLQRDVPTFEIWKDQGFSHITKAVDLKQIVNTMEFKFYERYVKAFHQKVKGDINAWRDPTAVMVARGATEAEMTARTLILVNSGMKEDYVKALLGKELENHIDYKYLELFRNAKERLDGKQFKWENLEDIIKKP